MILPNKEFIASFSYIIPGKTLLDYTYLFPPKQLPQKNYKILYKCFKNKYGPKSYLDIVFILYIWNLA